MKEGLATLTDSELAGAIASRLYEANLFMRAAVLRGLTVNVDLVDRKDGAYPKGYTEIKADVTGVRIP